MKAHLMLSPLSQHSESACGGERQQLQRGPAAAPVLGTCPPSEQPRGGDGRGDSVRGPRYGPAHPGGRSRRVRRLHCPYYRPQVLALTFRVSMELACWYWVGLWVIQSAYGLFHLLVRGGNSESGKRYGQAHYPAVQDVPDVCTGLIIVQGADIWHEREFSKLVWLAFLPFINEAATPVRAPQHDQLILVRRLHCAHQCPQGRFISIYFCVFVVLFFLLFTSFFSLFVSHGTVK
jgi:hypothetical protein